MVHVRLQSLVLDAFDLNLLEIQLNDVDRRQLATLFRGLNELVLDREVAEKHQKSVHGHGVLWDDEEWRGQVEIQKDSLVL